MNVTQAVNRLGKFANAVIILAGGLVGLSRMSPVSSVLAWRIPGIGEPGWLLSMGSHRVEHN